MEVNVCSRQERTSLIDVVRLCLGFGARNTHHTFNTTALAPSAPNCELTRVPVSAAAPVAAAHHSARLRDVEFNVEPPIHDYLKRAKLRKCGATVEPVPFNEVYSRRIQMSESPTSKL